MTPTQATLAGAQCVTLTGRDGNTDDRQRPENECHGSCSSLGSPHCHEVDARCCILNTENEPLWEFHPLSGHLFPKSSIHVFEALLIVSRGHRDRNPRLVPS